MKSSLIKRWLVFYTKARHEKKINQELIEKGIHSYLPLIKVKKKWSDRYQTIEEPLFKSYIFAFVDEADRLKVTSTKGIVKTINFNGRIAVIPEY
ncbi:MAG: hypothetical protein N3A61_01480 [Ignavibacteria bacterium]|nr:hypothetical protein [Ignavibacteria bacterium]